MNDSPFSSWKEVVTGTGAVPIRVGICSASRISHGDFRRNFQWMMKRFHTCLLTLQGIMMRFAVRCFPILKVLSRPLGYQCTNCSTPVCFLVIPSQLHHRQKGAHQRIFPPRTQMPPILITFRGLSDDEQDPRPDISIPGSEPDGEEF